VRERRLGERGLGDLLRALSEVPRDQWDAVAVALGFERAAEAVAPTFPVVAPQEEVPRSVTPASARAARSATATVREQELPPLPVSSTVAVDDAVVPWLQVSTLSRPADGKMAAGPAPPYQPLLQPKQAPALLGTLCATARPTGRVDIPAAVEWLARRRPVRRLPRRDRQTLARGVQVLADAGDGLKPYARDREGVVVALERLVGEGLVADGWFLDDPARGVGFDHDLDRYEPPAPGTPVLLLTDLGIGGGAARRRWPKREHLVSLARDLAAQGSPTLALVPYPPTRWPAGLDRSIGLVFWDRRTTVSHVRRARRRAGAFR
jgi:hypothetical protein